MTVNCNNQFNKSAMRVFCAGAFVLPFIIMLGVAGVPLFFPETAFGQFAGSGVISIWKASPLFQGKKICINH